MMERRAFLGATGGAAAAVWAGALGTAGAAGRDRPNILWISCEDIGPHLGCYGDPEARTPHLDRLASQGTRYTHAFSVSGVCAPTRSCLITGMYPTTLGTCHMRCKHPPQDPIKCFPEYLRNAGYYCTNNSKTDYNFDAPRTAWDQCNKKAHWRNRRDAGQPFFAVFNLTITHESKVGTPIDRIPAAERELPPADRHDPAKATLPPYYPDTPVIRERWAHYYDLITVMDRQAGAILDELEKDGFADNTVVFYFSDHGVGLPRAKRWLYDSGTHVPFIVRWPGRAEPRSVSSRLVSFVDFAPTVLSIAGAPIPGHMQGRAFLGDAAATPRQYVFGARDRMDERYDLIRAVRDDRFRYIRNYEPYRPYAQYLAYPEGWPVMQDMRRAERAGELEGPETLFFRPTKPLEELYDVTADPHELENLAESPDHRAVLDRLRETLDAWLAETKDLGFVPEMELEAWLEAGGTRRPDKPAPVYAAAENADAAVFGRRLGAWIDDLNRADPLTRLRAVTAIGLVGPEAVPTLVAALGDPDSAVAHWAAVGLGHLGVAAPEVLAALREALGRSAISARLAAALALALLGQEEEALPVATAGVAHEDPYARLYAVQVLEQMTLTDAVRAALEKALDDDVKYAVRVAEHALGRPPSR